MLALGILGMAASIVVALAVVALAAAIFWKIRLFDPSIRYLTKLIKDVVHEETADLRKQMYPNGGSSLADKINTMRDDVQAIREGLDDVKSRLEVMHPTGEIPVTELVVSAESS